MKAFTSKLLKIGLLSTVVSTTAYAASGTSKYVEDVDLNFIGQAAVINIENTSANKSLSSLNLAVKTTNMKFDISSTVECKGLNVIYVGNAQAHFGPVSISGVGINSTGTLYSHTIDIRQ